MVKGWKLFPLRPEQDQGTHINPIQYSVSNPNQSSQAREKKSKKEKSLFKMIWSYIQKILKSPPKNC